MVSATVYSRSSFSETTRELQAKAQLPVKNVYARRSTAVGLVDFLFSKVDG